MLAHIPACNAVSWLGIEFHLFQSFHVCVAGDETELSVNVPAVCSVCVNLEVTKNSLSVHYESGILTSTLGYKEHHLDSFAIQTG